MKIFLHIGMPKTGTTTLQSFLSQNRKLLLEQGYLYPRSPGDRNHLKLPAFAMDQERIDNFRRGLQLTRPKVMADFRGKFSQKFAQELSRTQAAQVVLSSEHFSAQLVHETEINRLREFLCRFCDQIQIIIYLRRQDDTLLSSYSTEVKAGRTEKLSLPDEEERYRYYDYWQILQRWESVFGEDNISVRIFERAQLVENDLIKDFAYTTGIEISGAFQIPNQINLSLDADSCEFLRIFNRYVPRFLGDDLNANRGDIVKLLEAQSGSSRIGIGGSALDDFMQSFEDSNRKVATHYLDRQDRTLFLKDFSSQGRIPVDDLQLPLDTAFEIFAHLWNQKQQKIIEHKNASLTDRFNEAVTLIRKKIRRYYRSWQQS